METGISRARVGSAALSSSFAMRSRGEEGTGQLRDASTKHGFLETPPQPELSRDRVQTSGVEADPEERGRSRWRCCVLVSAAQSERNLTSLFSIPAVRNVS